MPLFVIRRQIDPTLPDTELEALTYRAIGASAEFPNIRWHRSYHWADVNALRSNCIYEAPSEEALRKHASLCAVPFSEIREVEEFIGDDHVVPDENQVPSNASRFLITRTMAPDATQEELDAAVFRSSVCIGAFDISWDRSFWDNERKQSNCIYLAPSEELIRKHAALARIECDSIQEVREQLPSEFAAIFDAFGLPRHCEGGGVEATV